MAIQAGKKRHFDFYADESVVNENSQIELTSTKTSLFPEFDLKFNNGWSETGEQPRKGYIGVTSDRGLCLSRDPIFKATFYRGNRQIGEKVISIKNRIDEQFEVPEYTTRVEFEVWAVWEYSSSLVASDTFKLSNKVAWDDVTKVKCNDVVTWCREGGNLVDISCPESWQRI